jgi:predicted enzyme related to lactoylglutathione lyase
MTDHPIAHIEFSANDPEEAGKFYNDLFGWKLETMPQMDYVTFETEPNRGGGFPRIDNEMIKPGDVIVYVHTDDIETSLAKVETIGGKVLLPKTEIPTIGWYAFFADPTGNRVALFTPK